MTAQSNISRQPGRLAHWIGSIGRRIRSALPGRTGEEVWRGVYASFGEAGIERADYATKDYLDQLEKEATRWLEQRRRKQTVALWHDNLAMVAASLASNSDGVSVVDFGGGLGGGYVQLRQWLGPAMPIRYIVVEIPDLVARGRQLFSGNEDIRFEESLDRIPSSPDILYVNSALQYPENPREVLRAFAGLTPLAILLDRSAIGDVPSFVTRQVNVPGKAMGYWFLNIDEVIEDLGGYELVCNGEVGPIYQQAGLPEDRRIPRMRTLLFRRADQRS